MIRRLILDVLKPHNPSKIELAEKLSKIKGIIGVNLITIEIDKEVENVKVILEGSNVDYEKIKKAIEDLGGAIHSVDEVAAGKKIIHDIKTPQDSSATYLR